MTLGHKVVTAQGDRDVLLVTGGSAFAAVPGQPDPNLDFGANTYEAYLLDPSGPTLSISKDTGSNAPQVVIPWGGTLPFGVFLGPVPSGSGSSGFTPNYMFQYPRMHLLSNGRFFLSGWSHAGGSIDHVANPGLWDLGATAAGPLTFPATWPGQSSAAYNGTA